MTKNEYGESVIKWVTITVLVAVSVFFVFLYKNIFIQGTPKGHTEYPTEQEPPNPTDNNKDKDPPIIPIIEYSTLPRKSNIGADGGYYNNTGGTGNEVLMNVIDLAGFYYLILETDSNGNDYKAERSSIAVAKFNYQGDLIKTLTLKASRDELYLESKITNNGILIAAKGEGGISYYLVSFELDYSKLQTNDNYQQLKMYYTMDYTLVLGINEKELTIKAISDSLNTLYSNSIQFSHKPNIVEIFPASYGYNIIVNLSNRTSYMTQIDFSGSLLSNSQISDKELLKIIPLQNAFVLLEQDNNNYISLRSINDSLVTQFNTLLGDSDKADFYPVHNGYIAFLIKNTGTVSYHISKLGEVITHNELDYSDVHSIESFAYTDNGIFFYANIESAGGIKNTKIINYSKNNLATYSLVVGGFMPDDAHTIIIQDDYAIIFMTSMSYNTYFINNYGNKDIFIMKIKLS